MVFFLEELSAQEMLKGIVDRLWGADVAVRYIVFEGKQDLEKQLVRKLKGYRNPAARFVVLRDLDAHKDCKVLKQRLLDLCAEGGRPQTLVRIACRELESFYLADLAAVEKGLKLSGLAQLQEKVKFRSPDRLSSPSEELRRLTGNTYQRVAGSRAIAPHLNLDNQRSDSFKNLISGLRRRQEQA